jgi:hypothetical protein
VGEVQEVTGRLGRLGTALKTEVEASELETEGLFPVVEGQLINNIYKESVSENRGVVIRDEDLRSMLETDSYENGGLGQRLIQFCDEWLRSDVGPDV